MKIGFIGTGNMARAMVLGLVGKKHRRPQGLQCIGGGGQSARKLAKDADIALASSRVALIESSEAVVLAFKPYHLDTVSFEEGTAAKGKLIISVLAGRTISSIRQTFPEAANIVRVMPNTPCRIGKGVSAYCFDKKPDYVHRQAVEDLLESLGSSYEVAEDQLHIVTAISGCGPAVFFKFVDLISEAGEARGLPRQLALDLAVKTGLGSLELLQKSGQTPQSLIDEVVSPNGVTHALLTSLARQNWAQVVDTGIDDAVKRSIELSKP